MYYICIEYNVNGAPKSMQYGGFAYGTPVIGQANGGISVATYTLVTETANMERCDKDIVKSGPAYGCSRRPGKGEISVDYSHWERLYEEIVLSMMNGVENRMIKRKHAEHRVFAGQ